MQKFLYTVVRSINGSLVPAYQAQLTVLLTNTNTQASVFNDAGAGINQPLLSDETGLVQAMIAPGRYDILINDGSVSRRINGIFVAFETNAEVPSEIIEEVQGYLEDAAELLAQATNLTPIVISGTSLTINAANQETYDGKLVVCTSASAVTISIAGNVTNSFYMMVGQQGAGRVKLQATAGATLLNSQLLEKTRGQGSVASVTLFSNSDGNSAVFSLGGDLAA